MCAIEAGKRGKSVLVLEHNQAIGEKIRIYLVNILDGAGLLGTTGGLAGPALERRELHHVGAQPHLERLPFLPELLGAQIVLTLESPR